ncbi:MULTISPECIES: galactokinase [unclassified Mycolicibacterium]|uniref:galactokinase n=1 Tax=unclassified Mycolicibacterium TaxID=2636767 RepID=UPI0012DCEF01|nr:MULTISPECIES: galactokinase [unclassified Mycolicibacterium]MUL81566.1 galactokinase [Mycolicibacterium sp. CBMA 329]MUL87332.1 galactokinase [Mycolicibacterium sp. CBMA 331]MUM02619.1 galactokinase [Mycolicibacterium sp. CBMA 334]MUM28930.1 galactokinase [Mycolicibacterium sp. CBMA 295]MUM37629.1 galactokinase [Mycolicibacterium sp. CBMA 247]
MTIRYSAPGRINLIGEHTDYNLGFALPIALPQRTSVGFDPDSSGVLSVSSALGDQAVRIGVDTVPGEVTGWAAYVAGVVWALRRAGISVPGGRMTITSDVEIGSGLSSSAALECAVLGALLTAAGVDIDRIEQARIAQQAENEYVGAPTGLLDQLASLFGEPGQAMLIDFRDVTVQPVRFDPEAFGVALLLIDSRARHAHAGGEYAARRASCERAAADLGVASLRDVDAVPALDGVSDPIDARRARHVLTENQRVLDCVAAMASSDFAAVGELWTASHASMRDDFEITTLHLDLIAEAAVQGGALGARMTGGGFGGCIIALVPGERVDAVGEAVVRAARDAGYPEPAITRTHAGGGAGPATAA